MQENSVLQLESLVGIQPLQVVINTCTIYVNYIFLMLYSTILILYPTHVELNM